MGRKFMNFFVYLTVAALIEIQWDSELGRLANDWHGLRLASVICLTMALLNMVMIFAEVWDPRPARRGR